MTAALPPHGPGWTSTAANGCTARGCGTQRTVTADGHNGRRCSEHAPRFDPTRAVSLMVGGWPSTATAYCRIDFEETA